ncbi:hypothetical protein N9U82_05795, partial [Prochlorococcus sp. AH-736-N03]|nr:hypothetical protein [Prochlorococcus sp. AH-736-N03]
IEDFLKIINLFIKTKWFSTHLHIYFNFIKENVDITEAFFVWEDGADTLSRIFCDLTRLNGLGVHGYLSATNQKSATLMRLLNCSKMTTNRIEIINQCKELYLDQKDIISYLDYTSECFSGSFEVIYKIKYRVGIVLPLSGPNTIIGNKFKKILISFDNLDEKILVSIHPQSDNGWSNLIKNYRSTDIRNHNKLTDIKFISICEKIIGADSSLKSLAYDLNKNYLLIN